MRGRMRRKEVRKTSRVNGYKTAFSLTPVRSKMLLCLSCEPPAYLSSDISIVGEEESVKLLKMSLISIAGSAVPRFYQISRWLELSH